MNVSPKASWSNNHYTLTIGRSLSPEEINKIHLISFLASEMRACIGKLPFCEVRQLPYRDKVVHYINDPDAQKLIEIFHRYGSLHPSPGKVCPFQSGSLRVRFTSWIGENNLMATYEDKSPHYRQPLLAFFKKQKLEELKVAWKKMTREWLSQLLRQGETDLFNACLYLIGKCLIKGMLDYDRCNEKDIQFHTEHWKEKFALSPDELKSLNEHAMESSSNSLSTPSNTSYSTQSNTSHQDSLEYDYSLDLCASYYENKNPEWALHRLTEKIYKGTLSKPQSLCHYLSQLKWSEQEIIEHIKVFLLAGQETVGYFLGFLLYEYAKNPSLQEGHMQNPHKITNAYLETLRLYSVGSTLREAREDMVLSQTVNGDVKEHFIRKGERINSAPYFSGYDASLWENPETFDCERPNLTNVRNNPHFGHGPHRCIGEKAAQVELVSIVEEVLTHVQLSTQNKLPELLDTFTWRPQHDIKAKFTIDWLSLESPDLHLKDVPKHLWKPRLFLSYVKKNGCDLRDVPIDQRTEDICLAAVQQTGEAMEFVPLKQASPKVCLAAVTRHGLSLKYIPEHLITLEICQAAVLQNGFALLDVPEIHRTQNIYLKAVQQNGMVLRFVPVNLRSNKIYETAVSQYPLALKDVPKDKITKEMAWKAVLSDGNALEYVPEEFITHEMCLEIVKKWGNCLSLIPKHRRTPDICLTAIKKGAKLADVPSEMKNEEIYLAAVSYNGFVLKDVPEELMTHEMCLESIKQWGDYLSLIPKHRRTPDICLAAVKRGAELADVPLEIRNEKIYLAAISYNTIRALRDMPEEERSEEICLNAVQNMSWALAEIAKNKRTPALCFAAVRNRGVTLKYVPEEIISEELCEIAVCQSGMALEFVPFPLQSPKICLLAVKCEGRALQFVPVHLRTPEICLAAVQNDPWAIYFVPKALRTQEICLEAVKRMGGTLKYVPKAKRTQEICLAAVAQYREAIEFVPFNLRTPELYMATNKKIDRHEKMKRMLEFFKNRHLA